MVLIQDT